MKEGVWEESGVGDKGLEREWEDVVVDDSGRKFVFGNSVLSKSFTVLSRWIHFLWCTEK